MLDSMLKKIEGNAKKNMNLVPQFICIILLHSYPLISVSFNSLNSDDPWASVLAEAEADKEEVSPKEKADGKEMLKKRITYLLLLDAVSKRNHRSIAYSSFLGKEGN